MRLLVALLVWSIAFTVNAESLQIGVLANDPPFSIQVGKGSEFTGFEVSLITEICKRIKAECTFASFEFDDLFQQVLDKHIDLAIARISITLDRAEQFLFSMPYLIAEGQLMTKSTFSIQQPGDLIGKKVGLYKASLYKNYLLNTFKNQVDVVEYNSIPLAFQGLIDGDVDALLLTKLGERYLIANSQSPISSFRFVGAPIPLGAGYGFMANVQSTNLIDRVNKALQQIEADGTYLRIYNLYFGLLSN